MTAGYENVNDMVFPFATSTYLNRKDVPWLHDPWLFIRRVHNPRLTVEHWADPVSSEL